jgi:hypothetical protein
MITHLTGIPYPHIPVTPWKRVWCCLGMAIPYPYPYLCIPTTRLSRYYPYLCHSLYMALSSWQENDFSGSTRLHCNLSDTINIMVHSSSPEGKVLWHIFKVSDANLVHTYIQEAFNGGLRDDPIHSQKYYLGSAHLAQLEAQHSIVPFTFYQAVGEAIYIPAGCVHQVSTMIA